MSFDDAIVYCAQYDMLVKTSSPNITVSATTTTVARYWTGSQRHNLTHFEREDGLLFKPKGIDGTWRGFPSRMGVSFAPYLKDSTFCFILEHNVEFQRHPDLSVQITLYKNGSLTAHTSNAERDCLCMQSNSATIKRFMQHRYFLIGLFVLLTLICIILLNCLIIRKTNCAVSSMNLVTG